MTPTPSPDEPDVCQSCIGTGIGNPHDPRSRCWSCNGSGIVQPRIPTTVEEPWAWNHYEPEPGDMEDEHGF